MYVMWSNWLWIPQPAWNIKGRAAWTLCCTYCSVIILLLHSAAVIWPCHNLSYTLCGPSFLHTNLIRQIDTWLVHRPVKFCSGASAAGFRLCLGCRRFTMQQGDSMLLSSPQRASSRWITAYWRCSAQNEIKIILLWLCCALFLRYSARVVIVIFFSERVIFKASLDRYII